MKDLWDSFVLVLQTYPYILYAALFLSVGWLIYSIIDAISQMDFGHGITDLYDKNGKKKAAKIIKVRFLPPVIATLIVCFLVVFVLH